MGRSLKALPTHPWKKRFKLQQVQNVFPENNYLCKLVSYFMILRGEYLKYHSFYS